MLVKANWHAPLCRSNRLSSLPVLPSGLQFLKADMNKLTSLPTPLPAALQTLAVSNNPLLGPAGLPDLSHCTELHTLVVGGNRLATLPPLPLSLKSLIVGANPLTSLSALPSSLRSLYVSNGKLTALDLSGCENLEEIRVLQTQLESLDFSGCVKLRVVCACGNMKLTSIANIEHLPLRELTVASNTLVALPVLPPTLEVLDVSDNRVAERPMPLPPKLRQVRCYGSLLSSVTIG